ncbi:D-alanyl-D-alanine dipeptidase [Gordonia paraffinivorans]|uniref:M15 family metallopeptidase n=1 Tax=Gordonia paraffinivorans TaxID=175628 RepID=UPI000D60638E|nr:M15 family metallopeptidase [Gordonia paraffinivorans]PWD41217.1 D-alanyl-D-alanine dipeptidase [Gordonia paraffinivorans]
MVLSSARRAAMVVVSAAMALAFSAACAGATPGEEPPAAGTRSAPDTSGVVHSSPASPAPQSFSPTPRPAVDDRARALGFVDVRTAVPDAVVDLRYATPRNFVGERLYPANARCLVHDSLVPGLRTAAENLRARGETLVFWDCYRPHSVQQRMFEKVPDPAWVAAPGPYSTSHESGRSVDVTLAARNPNCPVHRRVGPGLCLVDMGTDFDSFTPNATAYATQGVSASAQAARARLRKAMAAGGLEVYPGEWWHFDGPGADVRRPIIDVPLA